MRKLSLSLLAASAMLIAGVATAQPAPGARPGATWRGGAMPNVQMRGPNMQMRGHMGGGNVRMQGGSVQMHGGNFQMRGGGNFRFHRWGPHPGRNFHHGRLRRGGFINSYWFAPQFYIGDWGAYGFYAPGEDQRWVRYYDDAYLIDGDGRVIDGRYGVDWDRNGEDWDEDDGIPAYRGRHGGDAEDYAYEESEESEGHAEMRGGHGGYGRMMPPPGYGPPPPGTHVYGGGYGYGYYAYPIVIETVTTSGSSGYTEEIVEEYVQTAHRRRAHRPRPRCSCAPPPRPAPRRPAPRPRPRPPAGERG